MTQIQKRQTSVQGSVYDLAFRSGEQVEAIVANAEVVVMIDISSSMNDGYSPSRFDRAVEALTQIQTQYPGKVLVISFNDVARYELSGVPAQASGSTNMTSALELAKQFDDTGMRFILISDGEPNDPNGTRRFAEEFIDPIDTIYIGPDSGRGLEFLRSITTGTHAGKVDPKLLGSAIAGLLGGR